MRESVFSLYYFCCDIPSTATKPTLPYTVIVYNFSLLPFPVFTCSRALVLPLALPWWGSAYVFMQYYFPVQTGNDCLTLRDNQITLQNYSADISGGSVWGLRHLFVWRLCAEEMLVQDLNAPAAVSVGKGDVLCLHGYQSGTMLHFSLHPKI